MLPTSRPYLNVQSRVISGIGVVFSVSYEWVTTSDRSELLPSEWVIWVVTAMALMTVVSSVAIFIEDYILL